MIAVVSPIESVRYRYAWEQWMAPIPIVFLTKEEAVSFNGPTIDHGGLYPNATFKIPLENKVFWNIDFNKIENWRSYLTTKSYSADLPEDDFLLAVFYLYARLDEYFPEHFDNLGRFQSRCAIQSSWSGVQIPYIDYWRKALLTQLNLNDVFVSSKTLTVDVDSAFAFANKGAYRTLGGILKDAVSGRFSQLLDRLKVVLLGKKDPYDTYDWIAQQMENSEWNLIYFLLVADFSRYDIGLPFEQKHFRNWMIDLAKTNHVGWHPGFASHDSEIKWNVERSRMSKVLSGPVEKVRMHYLKMNLPITYGRLIREGIAQDYTMGFAEMVGFRAGTSRPFHWFDWEHNERRNLEIIPFCYMEDTFRSYMKYSPEQAMESIDELKNMIKETNGNVCILWHNSSVSEYREWRNWRNVLLHTIKD